MAVRPGEPSVGELVVSIKDDLTAVVRGEIELAKAEMRESAAKAGTGAALVAVAVFLLVLFTILVSIALAYALTALGLHPGWAFLIVAGAYLLLALLLGLIARSRFKAARGPERTRHAAAQLSQALRPSSRT